MFFLVLPSDASLWCPPFTTLSQLHLCFGILKQSFLQWMGPFWRGRRIPDLHTGSSRCRCQNLGEPSTGSSSCCCFCWANLETLKFGGVLKDRRKHYEWQSMPWEAIGIWIGKMADVWCEPEIAGVHVIINESGEGVNYLLNQWVSVQNPQRPTITICVWEKNSGGNPTWKKAYTKTDTAPLRCNHFHRSMKLQFITTHAETYHFFNRPQRMLLTRKLDAARTQAQGRHW